MFTYTHGFPNAAVVVVGVVVQVGDRRVHKRRTQQKASSFEMRIPAMACLGDSIVA